MAEAKDQCVKPAKGVIGGDRSSLWYQITWIFAAALLITINKNHFATYVNGTLRKKLPLLT